jgi:valyl-tRNA synthetase
MRWSDAGKHKMSKTRGNAVDPMEMAEKFGTDARFRW